MELVDVMTQVIAGVGAVVALYGFVRATREARQRIENRQRVTNEAILQLLRASAAEPDDRYGPTPGSTGRDHEDTEPEQTPSQKEIQEILARFAEDLEAEAARIAARAGAETHSVKHVRIAADRIGVLREKTSARVDAGLSIGAFVGGAGVSYGINLLSGGTMGSVIVAWIIGALGVVGVILYAVALTVRVLRN